MKKEIFAGVAAVVMFAFGGCAEVEGGAGETFGGADSVEASGVYGGESRDDAAEGVTGSVAESKTEAVTENVTLAETEMPAETTRVYYETPDRFYRKSEDESRTLVIDSDIFPYDCEEIVVIVDTEIPYYKGIEPYNCIDLSNIQKYTNLKRLSISDGNAQTGGIVEVVNAGGAAELENLEEVELARIRWWDEDWLSGIKSLKNLKIVQCTSYDGRFLENLSQVENLYLHSCSINDLSFLNGMSSLTELYMKWLELNNASFDGLEDNYSLKRLDFDDNSAYCGNGEYALTDITGLSRLRGLEYMYINEGHLVDCEKQIEEMREKLPACKIKF